MVRHEMGKIPDNHIILLNPLTNVRMALKDTDIWGIQCALRHCLDSGYAKENQTWFESMFDTLDNMRDPIFEPKKKN